MKSPLRLLVGILGVLLAASLVSLILAITEHYHPKCPAAKDYEIQLHMDTVWIWDGDRLVGRYITNWQSQMDSIIIDDNQ